jgi:hypothetical protein
MEPTRLLAQLPEPKASNDQVMKPSNTNRQLPGVSGIRGEFHSLSGAEVGLAARPHVGFLSERRGKTFFLTSPLIGLIDTGQRT